MEKEKKKAVQGRVNVDVYDLSFELCSIESFFKSISYI